MRPHVWSGWPGAWCLVCGVEDIHEIALACDDCQLAGDGITLCAQHLSEVQDCKQEVEACCLGCRRETRMVFYGNPRCEGCGQILLK